MKTQKTFQKGFTLIELLVVIAVIGVLAGAIIVAINPVDQLKRARDTQRISSTSQIAGAVSAFYASKGGIYPTANTTWITQIQSQGELKVIPAAVYGAAGFATCAATAVQNGYCYLLSGNDFVVWSRLESLAQSNKCPTAPNTVPVYLFSSAMAQGGIACLTTSEPATTAGYTFVNP